MTGPAPSPPEAAPPLDAPILLAQAAPAPASGTPTEAPQDPPAPPSGTSAGAAEIPAPTSDAVPGEAQANLIDLLDALQQPPSPAPVAMTPQTPGWIVVGVALALLLVWAALARRRRRRANAWRREALAALAQAGDDPAAVAPILRRAALAARPRAQVAGLTGERWLGYLDETGGAGDAGFADGPGRALLRGPYDGRDAPAPGLGALAARWVRRAPMEGGR